MKTFRYDKSDKWFKGNTHIHSTMSDGNKNFSELADMYSNKGYDFLFRTDHWVASDIKNDPIVNYSLKWFDGIEIDGFSKEGSSYHIVCLGTFSEIKKEDGLQSTIDKIKAQNGFVIMAHPLWCGNSFKDTEKYNFDCVEVYNHICETGNGTGNSLPYWRWMLNSNVNMLSIFADDTHMKENNPCYDGGWIMVNANKCTQESILESLKSGKYYSTNGPEIHEININDSGCLQIKTSPVNIIRLAGPGGTGINVRGDELVDFAEFKIPDWKYIYIELVDKNNKKAITNNILY